MVGELEVELEFDPVACGGKTTSEREVAHGNDEVVDGG